MATRGRRGRVREFEDLLEAAPQEVDPEEDRYVDSSEDNRSDEIPDGGREHYVSVGKSKLRKPKEVALGPQYRGNRVSRDALDKHDEDDPFSRGFDEESTNGELYALRGSEDDSDEGDSADDDAEDDDAEDTQDTDLSDEDEEEEPTPIPKGADEASKAELRRIMAEEQKAVAANISQATRADAEKGRAIKKQLAAFDSLLNIRIKLQKTLVATNTIVAVTDSDGGDVLKSERREAEAALKAAETAAFKLWSSLNDLREAVLDVRAGSKRKRPAPSEQTSTAELWQHMRSQEESSLPHRNATLQRWSIKTRGATASQPRSKLNTTAPQTTIIDVLNEQLSNPERLLKRAHTPRSCAPLQASQKLTEDPKIYDDADFYGLLLKELLEQKSADSAATANIVDMDFSRMRREAKTRKNVDTKASKGRKLRYTVHEKLQNFMAPEDRGAWGERQAEELFGSLFGRRVALTEEVDAMDEDEDDVDEAEAGLMMFRS